MRQNANVDTTKPTLTALWSATLESIWSCTVSNVYSQSPTRETNVQGRTNGKDRSTHKRPKSPDTDESALETS